MNELMCEMCGSNDVVKQDGLFVCQSCGTKYSVEEARKIMAGETVEVEGTVKIDHSSELSNLYKLARRAKDTNNGENALKYYDQILVKDPNNWEAQFYVVYYKAMQCKIAEIGTYASNMRDSLGSILGLVKDYVDEDEQEEVILEIYEKCSSISTALFNGAKNWYDGINNYKVRKEFLQEYVNHIYPIPAIMFNLGDGLIEKFGGEFPGIATRSWIDGIDKQALVHPFLSDKKGSGAIIKNYTEKVQKYQPDFKPPLVNTGACYVATSIYGSYDCPEVWTLRRFRDNTLDKNIFGRLFIKSYYATSPTIVKYFGDKKIFNKIFKPILDRFVKKLNEKGVKSTFYRGN